MTQNECEQEPLVIGSARSGVWPADLKNHLTGCAICAETKRVAEVLLAHTAIISADSRPPAANLVWQQMQVRRQQLALSRATRCMTWMRILAAVYAIILAAWYLPQLWHMQPALSTGLSTLSGGMVFMGVVTAVVAVVLGSCCFVLLGSRTTFRLL